MYDTIDFSELNGKHLVATYGGAGDDSVKFECSDGMDQALLVEAIGWCLENSVTLWTGSDGSKHLGGGEFSDRITPPEHLKFIFDEFLKCTRGPSL